MAAPKGKRMPAKKAKKAGTNRESAAQRKVLFAKEYLANGGNATQAAIKVGYSAKTADQQGSRLLKDVKVREIIEASRGKALEDADLNLKEILLEAKRLALFDPRKLFDEAGNLKPIKDLDADTAAALAQIDVYEEFIGQGDNRQKIGETKKIKIWDKNAALEKLFKHLGLYKEDNTQKGEAAVAALIAAVHGHDTGSGFPIRSA